MKIPSNKQWTQDNSGDVLGILGSTTNMAMDTIGKATLARKVIEVYGSDDDNGFGYLLALTYFNNLYIALTDNDIFKGNLPDYSWGDAGIGSNPSFSLGSDALIFNDLYTVTTDTSLYTWNGIITWTDRTVALTSGVPHPIDIFGVQLAIGNGNTVLLINTSYTTTQTLTLPTEYQVTTIRCVNNYIYIGTKNLNGGNAKIFVWNGDSTLFDYECEVGAPWVFSMTPYLSTVAAITSQGQLGIVNGTNFQELAGLPVYYKPHARWQGSGGLTLNGKVFNRGMCTIGDTIYLNIDGEVDSVFMPEMKSGIWGYDPAIGLYHRASASFDKDVSDSSLTRSGDVLTTSATHLLKTGDAVVFSGVLGLTGVNSLDKYYVTVVSPTEIKLSQSRKGVQKQQYVTLGGTPGGSDNLRYAQNSDYGTYNMRSGAIAPMIYSETPYSNFTSEILWGSRITQQDGTTEYGIFSFADSYNIGSFTTQRIYGDNIDQTWKEIYNFIDGLTVDTESVVVKAQTIFEEPSTELTGVWLSVNTLNSNSSEDVSAWSDIEVGYEVVIVDGYGRGQSAHVLEKNTSSGTVSLVLDESIGTINETCTLYYTTFKKIGQGLTLNEKMKEKVKANANNLVSPWVVLKIELRGFAPAVNMLELSNIIQKGGQ
jgi:hypothetical protein